MNVQTFASPTPDPGPAPSHAGAPGGDSNRSGRIFTIEVGGEWYGVPIERVRHVFRITAITPTPLTPPAVAGLINVRGEILAAIHTSLCLGFAQKLERLPALVVSVEHLGENFGLIVGSAGDVVTIAYDQPVALPATYMPATNLPAIHGQAGGRRAWPTYHAGDALYPVLDVAALISALKAESDPNQGVSRVNLPGFRQPEGSSGEPSCRNDGCDGAPAAPPDIRRGHLHGGDHEPAHQQPNRGKT